MFFVRFCGGLQHVYKFFDDPSLECGLDSVTHLQQRECAKVSLTACVLEARRCAVSSLSVLDH